MSRDLYCKIYVKSPSNIEGVGQFLRDRLHIDLQIGTLFYKNVVIYVLKNRTIKPEDLSDFLNWPISLDIEPIHEDTILFNDFVEDVKNILRAMRDGGLSVVPACTFESELVL